MPKKSHKLDDIFSYLRETYGLNSNFFRAKLGMTSEAFYAARVRGFYPREVEKLNRAFHEIGAFLTATDIPDSLKNPDTRWDPERER